MDETETANVVAQKAAGELLVIGNDLAERKENLQDSFLRFKKERQMERRLSKRTKETSRAVTVADKEALRQHFISTCKGYLGVPYHKKYAQDPDDPDHNAPLFLDCCGLVRRALLDLRDEFGFVIGHWNQAYQFETLPEVLTFEQLKPGDLVFCEGLYYNEKARPQKHDIVHVEVFLGGETGEATIGSRYARSEPAEGKVRGVQILPSYKYTSKKYEVIKFHFRSLDTWLNGICKSQSFPDAVTSAAIDCGGKSIFEEDDASGDEADEGAGFVPNPWGPSPVLYIGEGNNWQAVTESMERRGWRRLPFDAGFSTRYDLKWVESKGKIDYRRHIEGQLVNHIPNNDVITNKVQLLDTVRQHQATCGEDFPWHPRSFCSGRPGEKLAAMAEAEANPDAVWILKPSRGNGGKGIEIVQGVQELREFLFPWAARPAAPAAEAAAEGEATLAKAEDAAAAGEAEAAHKAYATRVLAGGEGYVVQRYLERPLLLQGRKFDLRAYCLVARTTKHVWLFHPGYVKISLEPYDADIKNRFAHITNACQQKIHPSYKESRGQHIWSLEQAEENLINTGRWAADRGAFWPPVHEEMKRCLTWLYEASKDKLERRRGYFDLLGVDFILDDTFGVHLLEVNSNPAIWFDSSPVLKELVPRLLGHTMDTVLDVQRPEALDAASAPAPPVLGAFELIVDEASGFTYRPPAAQERR